MMGKSIEQSLKKLAEIGNALQNKMELDKAMEMYREGLKASKECAEILKFEKGKLEELVDEMKNITQDFTLDEKIY